MTSDEDPFELIQKGNAFEASSDHWRSSEFYSRASTCLRTKADNLSSQIRNSGTDADPEKRKVISLFRAQSLEYLYKARHCLLEALRFENDQDRLRTLEVAKSGSGSLDPLFSMLSREESEKRRLIFERLFSGDVEEVVESHAQDVVDVGIQADVSVEVVLDESEGATVKGATESNTSDLPDTTAISKTKSPQIIESTENSSDVPPNNAEEVDDRQQSIEERLAKLDSSLLPKVPPPFISGSRTSGGGDSENRLEEIQRGLRGLGVSLPDNSGKKQFIPENLSAEDQVKLIIQQANDEVQIERGMHIGEGGDSNGMIGTANLGDEDDIIDENDSMFEGFEDDEYDVDALLAKAETLVAKTGTEVDGDSKHSSEYVQIRKAQALLLEARLCLEMVHAKSSDENILPDNNLEKAKNGEKNDASDSASEKSVEKDQSQYDNSQVAARRKARGLIENAQDCMNKLLIDWK